MFGVLLRELGASGDSDIIKSLFNARCLPNKIWVPFAARMRDETLQIMDESARHTP